MKHLLVVEDMIMNEFEEEKHCELLKEMQDLSADNKIIFYLEIMPSDKRIFQWHIQCVDEMIIDLVIDLFRKTRLFFRWKRVI